MSGVNPDSSKKEKVSEFLPSLNYTSTLQPFFSAMNTEPDIIQFCLKSVLWPAKSIMTSDPIYELNWWSGWLVKKGQFYDGRWETHGNAIHGISFQSIKMCFLLCLDVHGISKSSVYCVHHVSSRPVIMFSTIRFVVKRSNNIKVPNCNRFLSESEFPRTVEHWSWSQFRE